ELRQGIDHGGFAGGAQRVAADDLDGCRALDRCDSLLACPGDNDLLSLAITSIGVRGSGSRSGVGRTACVHGPDTCGKYGRDHCRNAMTEFAGARLMHYLTSLTHCCFSDTCTVFSKHAGAPPWGMPSRLRLVCCN